MIPAIMTGTMSVAPFVSCLNLRAAPSGRDAGLEMLTLDDQVGAKNTHGSNANTRLGGTVRGTQAGEDDGNGATHGSKEGLKNRHVSELDA